MTDLKCPHCGYEWEYGGVLILATCPSCARKIDVEDNQVEA